MPNKVAILFGSSRSDGDTSIVVDYFYEKDQMKLVDLNEYNIGYYDYEQKNVDDDFIPLMQSLTKDYDVFLFATPIYWYSMSAQTKTFLDRITDLLKIKKEVGRKLRGKTLALISVSNDSDYLDSFSDAFSNTAEYLGMNFGGHLHTWVQEGNLPVPVKQSIMQFIDNIKKGGPKKLTSDL